MNLIAAADKNWGIGYKGELLCHIKEDMKFFRETTEEKCVIMGKSTFLSLPGQKPLKNRKNIILTTEKNFQVQGAEICRSFEEAAQKAREEFEEKDIFIIGGERVYNENLDYCDTAYITKIEKIFEADKHLKNLESLDNWQVQEEKEVVCESGIKIIFKKFQKRY